MEAFVSSNYFYRLQIGLFLDNRNTVLRYSTESIRKPGNREVQKHRCA